MALPRTYSDFVRLDRSVRLEMFGSESGTVGEDGLFLPALPPSRRRSGGRTKKAAEMDADDDDDAEEEEEERREGEARGLEEYLASMLRLPEAVRSSAVSEFLSVDRRRGGGGGGNGGTREARRRRRRSSSAASGGDGDGDEVGTNKEEEEEDDGREDEDEEDPIEEYAASTVDGGGDGGDRSTSGGGTPRSQYLDYLLQHDMTRPLPSAADAASSSSPSPSSVPDPYRIIPRRSTYAHTVEALPPGWWIVWQFRIESGVGPYSTVKLPIKGGSGSGKRGTAVLESSVRFELSVVGGAVHPKHPRHPDPDDGEEEEEALFIDDEEGSEPPPSTSSSSSSGSDPPSAATEIVHSERCSFDRSQQPYRGSYRFHPDFTSPSPSSCPSHPSRELSSAKAVLTFASIGSLSLLRPSKIWLECAAVPHEAFRAACAAAFDSNERRDRRDRAPLLGRILDCTDGNVRLVVEPWTETKPDKEGKGEDAAERVEGKSAVDGDGGNDDAEREIPSTAGRRRDSVEGGDGADPTGGQEGGEVAAESYSGGPSSRNATPATAASADGSAPDVPPRDERRSAVDDDVLRDLRRQLAKVRADRDRAVAELDRRSRLRVDDERKLRLLASEKRVWEISRTEIQSELNRLSERLASERREKSDVASKLEASETEIRQLKGQVTFLECRSVPREEEERRTREVVENAERVVEEMRGLVGSLEGEVAEWRGKCERLEAQLIEHKRSSNELLVSARAEADEARMMQRILEGKVRALRRTESGTSRRGEGGGGGGDDQNPSRAGSSSASPGGGKRRGPDVDGASSSAAAAKTTAAKTSSIVEPPRALRPHLATYVHPDDRLNERLVELRERHAVLRSLLERDPTNERNLELIRKIEAAVSDIASSGRKKWRHVASRPAGDGI